MANKSDTPFLQARGLTLTFGRTFILKDIHFHLERGEIFCLLGPSGCGKTSLLRLIAGLESAAAGELRIAGQDLQPIPVNERGIGFMFQDYALFPHLDVAANVRFGLKMQGLPIREQQRRANAALAQVGLENLADRDVAQLSGGERQRVALARSLAPKPKLLLLDEPLGSLDANTREALGQEMRTFIVGAGIAAITVTHDRKEAFALADRVAIMRGGRILQIGRPEEIHHAPKNAFVARFFGQSNILPVLAASESFVRTAIGEFALPGRPPQVLLHKRGITPCAADEPGALTGEITRVIYRGEHYEIWSRHRETLLQYHSPSGRAPAPLIGSACAIRIDSSAILPLPAD